MKRQLLHSLLLLVLISVFPHCFSSYRAANPDNSNSPPPALITNRDAYPRIGMFHWGGGTPELYAKYDFVMGGAPLQAKKINPDLKILPTFGWQAYGYNETHLGQGFDHDHWYMKNSQEGDLWAGWGGYYLDFTDYCPASQNPLTAGLRFNQFLPDYILETTDLTQYDGVATDWLQSYPWGVDADENPLKHDIDMDRDNNNDFLVPLASQRDVAGEWIYWVENLLSKVRERLDEAGFSDKPLLINSGGFHDFGWSKSNGLVIEYGSDLLSYGLDGFKDKYNQWMAVAPQPHVMLINACLPSKTSFSHMRYFLGATLLGDAYFDPEDELSRDHYIKQYYDEMDLSLGQPTGDAQKLYSSGGESVWVRFFEKGVVLVNGIPSPQKISGTQLQTMPGYKGPYWRFQGSQDWQFNNGKPFSEVTLDGRQEDWQKIGDAIVLLTEPHFVIADIIIDNDPLMTSPGQTPAHLRGSWSEKQGGGAWSWGRYDWLGLIAYHTSTETGSQAIFAPTIHVPGQYEIFEWHGNDPDVQEATQATFTITHAHGSETIHVNQQDHQSQWHSLGVYPFNESTAANVTIDVVQNAGGTVLADACKFVFRGPLP